MKKRENMPIVDEAIVEVIGLVVILNSHFKHLLANTLALKSSACWMIREISASIHLNHSIACVYELIFFAFLTKK